MKIAIILVLFSGLFATNLAYADTTIEVGNQVSIAADVTNNLDTDLPFAYITQIKNDDGVVISLSWLTGLLSPNQSLTPTQSWIPPAPGTYYVEVYVWEDLDNPSALSPPLFMTINAVEPQV